MKRLELINMVDAAKIVGVECFERKITREDGDLVDKFNNAFNQSRIILFNKKDSRYTHVAKSESDNQWGLNGFLDLPFKTCSFENTEHDLLTFSMATKSSDKELGIDCLCFVVQEVWPGEYVFFSLCSYERNNERLFSVIYSDKRCRLYYILKRKTQQLIGDIQSHKNSIGIQKISERIKIRINGEKVIKKIKEVVICCENKRKDKYEKENSIEVNWSHRWEVRGHWRRIKGLGKNREGRYEVNNMTWVNPCVKGPESKNIVKKKRFFFNV